MPSLWPILSVENEEDFFAFGHLYSKRRALVFLGLRACLTLNIRKEVETVRSVEVDLMLESCEI